MEVGCVLFRTNVRVGFDVQVQDRDGDICNQETDKEIRTLPRKVSCHKGFLLREILYGMYLEPSTKPRQTLRLKSQGP